MAKKGQAKAKGQPKVKAAAAAVAVAVAANAEAVAAEPVMNLAKPSGIVADVNQRHLSNLEDALQAIMAHPLFSNIMHETPPKIDKDAADNEGGMQAGF